MDDDETPLLRSGPEPGAAGAGVGSGFEAEMVLPVSLLITTVLGTAN